MMPIAVAHTNAGSISIASSVMTSRVRWEGVDEQVSVHKFKFNPKRSIMAIRTNSKEAPPSPILRPEIEPRSNDSETIAKTHDHDVEANSPDSEIEVNGVTNEKAEEEALLNGESESATTAPPDGVAKTPEAGLARSTLPVLNLQPCYMPSGQATPVSPKNGDQMVSLIQLWKRQGQQSTVNVLSALYGIVLVVMGLAFPISQVISSKIPSSYFEGFYLYLYIVATIFLAYIYMLLKSPFRSSFGTIFQRISKKSESTSNPSIASSQTPTSSLYGSSLVEAATDKLRAKLDKELDPTKSVNHGSFYLRMGAVVFGVGSMIYSGLEFGQFFDMASDPLCDNVMAAVTPAARMMFTFIQMYFVFLNAKMQMIKRSNVTVARFGLMHMVATNLCVWLNVIIQETKHEILHFNHAELHTDIHTSSSSAGNHHAEKGHHQVGHPPASLHLEDSDIFNSSSSETAVLSEIHRVTRGSLVDECRRMELMGSLTQNASPFLFPCAIEYSLICAAIMYEIWKHTGYHLQPVESPLGSLSRNLSGHGGSSRRSPHHYSVDCTNANKGLFFGIFVLVMTIISMILFFVLINREDYKSMAITEVHLAEIVLYVMTLGAVVIGMIQVHQLRFDVSRSLDLDNILLIVALTGVISYNTFTIIGTQFGSNLNTVLVLMNALSAILQGVAQTIFILDASKRQLYTRRQQQHKPGREVITFLLVTNFAMWAVITLEKSRFDAHPVQSEFFGKWPWAIITNVSTPLAIFYRYHSTVCLCEIWKRCYKVKN